MSKFDEILIDLIPNLLSYMDPRQVDILASYKPELKETIEKISLEVKMLWRI